MSQEASLSAKLFNGLVRMDDDLNIIPDIASKWKISENGLVYRFELKRRDVLQRLEANSRRLQIIY